MKPRAFTNRIEIVHKNWLSRALGIPQTYHSIDMANGEVAIELKCRKVPNAYSFCIDAHQIDMFERQYPGAKLFWGFLQYDLIAEIEDIEIYEPLEPYVMNRIVWFLPWDWVKQLSVRYTKGGPVVYANKKTFCKEEFNQLRMNGGILFIPEGEKIRFW